MKKSVIILSILIALVTSSSSYIYNEGSYQMNSEFIMSGDCYKSLGEINLSKSDRQKLTASLNDYNRGIEETQNKMKELKKSIISNHRKQYEVLSKMHNKGDINNHQFKCLSQSVDISYREKMANIEIEKRESFQKYKNNYNHVLEKTLTKKEFDKIASCLQDFSF